MISDGALRLYFEFDPLSRRALGRRMAAVNASLLDLEADDCKPVRDSSADQRQLATAGQPPGASTAMWALVRALPRQAECMVEASGKPFCTNSPGSSLGSRSAAAVHSSLLDLAADACSQPLLQPQLLPVGATVLATTFWSDFETRGSVFQYCCR